MDNTGSRSSRDSDSSPLPCSSFSDDFSDSQDPDEGIPPKRIRDFEFEENTLQEFPATSCTSRPVNIPESPSTGVTIRERAAKIRIPAKENINPVIPTSLENERDDSLLNRATSPFANDFRVLRHRKNSDKPKATTGGTCLNCKVSIDLKKIRDLVETKPHLFSKCDEADCDYKSQEQKLTGVCKIKNKWLLVKSQSENDFYGVSTRSRLLYKSKSLENLSAAKESVPQKKEETKNRPSTRTGLRRGLKRKCRFSMPCS